MRKISWTKRQKIISEFWESESVTIIIKQLAEKYCSLPKQISRIIQSWDSEEDTYWQKSYKDLAMRVHSFRKLAKEYLGLHLSSKTVRYNQARQEKNGRTIYGK